MEILFVVVIGMVIMTMTMRFFSSGSRLCLDYARKAEASLTVKTLKKCWRDFVTKSGVPVSVGSDKIVFDGGNYAKIENGRLAMSTVNGMKYLALSFGSTASFGEENVSGKLKLYTITMLPYSARTVHSGHEKVRIVACIREPEGDNGK